MTPEQAFIRALLTNEAALRAYEYACAVNLRYDPGQIQAALHRALRALGASGPDAEARPESAREMVRRLTAEACAEVRAAIGDEWGSRPLREGIGEMRRRMIAAENAVAAYRAEQSSEPTVDEMARDVRPTFADKLRALGLPTERDEHGDYDRGMAVYASLQTRGLSAGVRWLYWTAGSNMPDDRRWPTAEAAVDELYAEWVAKQQAALGARPDSPPTDPSALAAWLYARVVPGRMVVERGGEYKAVVRSVARGRRCIILTGPDGEQVTAPGTLNLHLLNPDGSVLWEAK